MSTNDHPVPFYGYQILIPADADPSLYRSDLYALNDILPDPLQIVNLISKLPSSFEYTEEEYRQIESQGILLIGFVPRDLDHVLSLSKWLDEYKEDNVLFHGVELSQKALFYSGVEWYDSDAVEDEDEEEEEEDEEEDEDEDEEDEEEEEEEEYDEYDDEYDEEEDTSDVEEDQ
jgi:hypothetical protein